MGQQEWSTLIGPDYRDTVLSLVEPYYAGAKVYATTTHLKASKIPFGVLLLQYGMIGGLHARKGPIIGALMP